MARRYFSIARSAINLPAITATTVLQLVSGAAPVAILEIEVSFNGKVAGDGPALVELLTQTTAGTMSALTPQLLDRGVTYSLLASAQHTASAEPTAGVVLKNWYVHLQAGQTIFHAFIGDVVMDASTRLGLRVTTIALTNATAAAPYLRCEE